VESRAQSETRSCQAAQEDFSAATPEELREELARRIEQGKRAECMAHIQSHTVQLALDLIVREENIEGFFRAFMKSCIDLAESQACGVWLLDEKGEGCDLWMAYVGDKLYTKDEPDWDTLTLPRRELAAHLFAHKEGWTATTEYHGDDDRLPDAVRKFNLSVGLKSLSVTPLALPSRNLGWIALATNDDAPEDEPWRRLLLEAVARQATLALHQSQLAEESRAEVRRQAVLEERNRIARDIHDTLAQGFAAILMQLQSVQKFLPSMPATAAHAVENAIDLSRSHMIEARRSVGALRPQDLQTGDLAVVLERVTDLARRATDVPIELLIEDLPPLAEGIEREIAAITQEALTNAVRHARAKHIKVHASGTRAVGFRLSIADDGRGIAKERLGAGFGLTSMQERAERIGGSLTIVTAPRAGTEVVLAWEPPAFSIPTP
jgi:signal transduction histidine kinase